MQVKPPPTQDNVLSGANRFFQTWILWFQSVYKKLLQLNLGWAYYQDGQYTVPSPRSITSGRTQITIDGLGSVTQTAYLPDGVTSWLSSNTFTPDAENDAYNLRLDMSLVAGSPSDRFNLEIEVAPGDIIFSPTYEMNKGAGTRHYFSISVPIWIGTNFFNNGGKFYINTTNSFTMDTVGLFINKTYKA